MDTQQTETAGAGPGVRRVAHMIRGIKVAMLTTVASDGALRSRPMATQEAEFDGVLWFFTKVGSGMVDEVMHDAEVNVAYVSPVDHRYVSVSGKAALVRDPDELAERWAPSYRSWFAQGLDDPELALLRIDVQSAEYWDMLSGGMVTTPMTDPTRVGN